jgi:hypothetical protein
LRTIDRDAIKEFRTDEDLNNSPAGKRLDDFISQERQGWERKKFRRDDFSRAFLVEPKLSNPRIRAQEGAFLIFGVEPEINSRTAGIKIDRIRISKDHRQKILESLQRLGISEATLKPEIDNTAQVLLKQYRSSSISE